ncbi:NAD(P)-dependent oxidoreductase [uncultured Amnibacterium sp.]|uniref:NAD(P)-dependent oxidoreductase n=1 Tax=uncultured Amnibacterium sp. TaxID=1631851 RepID=UPI0035CBCB37
MRIAVLGATGRTGRLLADELLRRDHEVVALVRDAASAALQPRVGTVEGDARDAAAVDRLLTGTAAVCSALGPRRGDPAIAADVAEVLIAAMRTRGVRRFVGISGAGVTIPGDRKSPRDRAISAAMQRLGGAMVRDKRDEYERWAASGLDWTLVRPPRLVDTDAAGAVEHAASTSPRRTSIARADLAAFLVDCVEQGRYVGAAPLVARGR